MTAPWKYSEIVIVINRLVDAAMPDKSMEQIATEAAFESGRFLKAVCAGEMRLPLDKAIPLALALNTEPGEFMRLALKAYMPLPDAIRIVYDPGLDEEATQVDLNFKVAASFHTRFKVEAARRGWSMKQLLEHAFYNFIERAPPA